MQYMPEALSGLVEPLEQGCRSSSSFARLFEGIKFSVEFGEHLFSRDAFATVELCQSFGDFVAQLLALYLIELLSLFEQQKRLTNDLTQRLSGNKAFIREEVMPYTGQGEEQTYWIIGLLTCC